MADQGADGVLDEAQAELRMMLTMAAQSARSALNTRREAAERATRRDLEEARLLQARLEGERVAARAALARIRQELRDRYGIDVNESGADPSVVQARLVDGGRAHDERAEQEDLAREQREVAAGLAVEAGLLELDVDQAGVVEGEELRELAAEVAHDAELAWDSAQRREGHAAAIEGPDAPAAAGAWKQANIDNAKHPREEFNIWNFYGSLNNQTYVFWESWIVSTPAGSSGSAPWKTGAGGDCYTSAAFGQICDW